MATTPIRATDEIVVPHLPGEVWPLLADVAGYPRWWPPSLHLRVLTERPEIIGTEIEIRPGRGRPFRCRVEALDEPRSLLMRYGGGLVEGRGEWRLEPVAGGSRVTYDLDVSARGVIVALVARVTSIHELHSGPMREVLTALERELAARGAATGAALAASSTGAPS